MRPGSRGPGQGHSRGLHLLGSDRVAAARRSERPAAGRPDRPLAGDGEGLRRGIRQGSGGWEFAVDAGKVNTREKGWRDLKIAVAQERPTAKPATAAEWESRELPEATARVMWADISATRRFRRSWHARLKRLGLTAMAGLHVLGDGASWIWKAAGRALTG